MVSPVQFMNSVLFSIHEKDRYGTMGARECSPWQIIYVIMLQYCVWPALPMFRVFF
ncbi:hypothetical protein BDV41DRAFT_533542 [Aspergillus transmontanensis]|uniref:Uncharacterized protein n=1 Tax=Aspergillus transmontanensis TaxID=1034304 RepID=A0A5N6W5P7_9EURO|nr:hypothetical protein BDV41DRAFT_533542 [Aspergillus transmontanensis]